MVGEAGDGAEAVALVARHRPDIVRMDIRMPRTDGLTATRELTARADGPRVIVLTTFDTEEMVLTALRHGALGFLLKAPRRPASSRPCTAWRPGSRSSPSVTAQLIAAVTHVIAAVTHEDDSRKRAARARLDRLTEREREVALAVATVKTHIGRLFTKLDASNRVQIALCVHDAGLA